MAKDRIYSEPMARVGGFEFDDRVAAVFPDMIARSVPGYASILSMIEQLAGMYAVPDSNIYDLGCSLGAATLLMRRQVPASCTIHAVDSSAAMIRRLRKAVPATVADQCAVQADQADIRDVDISAASLVILNLTLQFLPPADRQPLLQKVFDGLLPGGALVLSEKVSFESPEQQQLLIQLHHEFKRAQGYSDLEIAQKRTAIENRLIPESLTVHVNRLRECGFAVVAPWFQCFNFASVLALRQS